MRVISCSVQNFASYESLDFNFENQGLTLIQGATGSGKSTLCDIIPWILFGTTSKNGTVDEIRSWNADKPTIGRIVLSVNTSPVEIVRIRAPKANDLYIDSIQGITRGKDLNDTQKLINALLGMDSSLYLAGAYFHEFSQTAQFFVTTPKNRRTICEQLVDLSLAKTLQTQLTDQKKKLVIIQLENNSKLKIQQDRLQVLARKNNYQQKFDNFETDKEKTIYYITEQINTLKNQINEPGYYIAALREIEEAQKELGDSICSECGAPKNHEEYIELNNLKLQIEADKRENVRLKHRVEELKEELNKEKARENTYGLLIANNKLEENEAVSKIQQLNALQDNNTTALADVEYLLELTAELRGVTIKNTIQSLEDNTNKLLSEYYDAEIKVFFDILDADKLEVIISKDGNKCSYTQLSKGQRQLLKLCFGISVMKSVANHHGLDFNCIFLDEVLDGISDELKVKTFRLLESLTYESIFVVDHSEAFKSRFNNKYTVNLVNGKSELT